MRLKNCNLEAKKYKNLSIELEDEYKYMDFYRYEKSDYNYTKRKYDPNYCKSGDYVGLYEDESVHRGYFYVARNMLLKDQHIYQKYCCYFELLEFGYNKNDLDGVNFLVDYLFYYCKTLCARFLKVKTKEKDFEKFYEVLRKYKHTIYKDYMYFDLNPVIYENMIHLKKYKGDKFTLKELYHLNEIGFDLDENKGVLVLKNNQVIEVDRKTRKITYPEMFKNLKEDSKYNYFNYYSSGLIHYIKSNIYDYYNCSIEFDYKIEGLEDRELIKAGYNLITLEKDKYIKDYKVRDDIKEFAEIVCTKAGITSMNVIIDSYFVWKAFYGTYASIWIYLEKYLHEEEEEEEY